MDATPTPASPRARGKSAAGKSKPELPETNAKPARSRKSQGKEPEVVSTPAQPTDLTHSIATTAYFLAEGRNFEPGHELEDWLEAERRVRAAQ